MRLVAGNRESTRGADTPPVRCLLSRTDETGSKCSWLSGRSSLWCVVARLAALVSAGRCSWCLVPLPGPLVGSGRLGLSSALVPRSCFFLLVLKRGYSPGSRPEDRFFDRYPFYSQGSYDLLGRGTCVFLRFLIFFLFSVCSDRCLFILSFQ